MLSARKTAIICGVLISLLMAINAFSQTTASLPDTPAGKYLARFIEIFNTGDENIWREFMLEDQKARDSAEVLERRMNATRMFHNDLGQLELNRVEEASDYDITVLVYAPNSKAPFKWINLTITLDTLPPHGLTGLGLRPGDDPGEKQPRGKLTDEELASYLDEFLTQQAEQDKFSGAVLVAKDGIPIFKKAYGMACKRYDVPNKIDTKFNLGSMNKMFTGVAIAQLAQQGKLSFDDPIGKYLPDYPNREAAEKVTIHHLLTHTSGMGSYWNELFEADWTTFRTVNEILALFAEKPLDFEPGAKFQYSNSGPIVLGAIIEKISGQSYYDYVLEHICKPAGMINTDCYEMDKPVPNLAIGYTKMNLEGQRGEEWRNNLFMHTVKGGPAGGGFSTVEDLFKFDNALRNHILLNEEYTELVMTGKVSMSDDPDDDVKYGYLFGEEIVNGQRIVGHSGGAPGINARLAMFMDSGYTVAVLANYDDAALLAYRKIEKLLTAE
jgi:CubicO group peptidase (beta-lactamase class C family)